MDVLTIKLIQSQISINHEGMVEGGLGSWAGCGNGNYFVEPASNQGNLKQLTWTYPILVLNKPRKSARYALVTDRSLGKAPWSRTLGDLKEIQGI